MKEEERRRKGEEEKKQKRMREQMEKQTEEKKKKILEEEEIKGSEFKVTIAEKDFPSFSLNITQQIQELQKDRASEEKFKNILRIRSNP